MRILIIDNYDSFTHNLAHQVAMCTHIWPVVCKNDETTYADILSMGFTHIILSPGPGHPEVPQDLNVCSTVLEQWRGPLLGVCLGCQGLATAHGGRITRLDTPVHGQVSAIFHDGSELFSGLAQAFEATRYHSLQIAEPLPRLLEKTAWTKDQTVMAIRHKRRPHYGVQFHPESITTSVGERLIRNFFRATMQDHSCLDSPGELAALNTRKQPLPAPVAYHGMVRKLGHYHPPEEVFSQLYGQRGNAFWLDSCQPGFSRSRFSYMGSDDGPGAYALHYWSSEQRLEIVDQRGRKVCSKSVFDFLHESLQECSYEGDDAPFDFRGGFVGYLGYELKAECGSSHQYRSQQPDASLLFVDRFLVFDLECRLIYLVSLSLGPDTGAGESWMREMQQTLKNLGPSTRHTMEGQGRPEFHLRRDHARYLADIASCKEKIAAGESYQICLTNQVHTGRLKQPFDVYRSLRRISPAPYSAYLSFSGVEVLSASPEQFLHAARSGQVSSKPIKGSMRRDPDPVVDAQIRDTLQNCPKERAENLMIVDLLRNDLSRTCWPGSVQVPKLMHIESYAHIHQMVSTIEGRLRPDCNVIDCLRACFPGGSMTGAPKIRTMNLLDFFEQANRGIYSGAIGYFSLCGASELNIVIRTIVNTPHGASIGCGGAITALSDPESEFTETMLKAAPAIEAILRQALKEPEPRDYRIGGIDPVTSERLMRLADLGRQADRPAHQCSTFPVNAGSASPSSR